jgi:hypothetical protein
MKNPKPESWFIVILFIACAAAVIVRFIVNSNVKLGSLNETSRRDELPPRCRTDSRPLNHLWKTKTDLK